MNYFRYNNPHKVNDKQDKRVCFPFTRRENENEMTNIRIPLCYVPHLNGIGMWIDFKFYLHVRIGPTATWYLSYLWLGL